jgi:RHS repeat-associated protein
LQVTSTETDHYYSFDAATHTELQAFSSGGSRWVDYLHGPGGLIGAIYTTVPAGGGAATATTLYYALDHLGSIAATVNAAGASPVLRSYDGWGKQRFTSGADDTANTLWGQNAEERGFLGQEQVAANGLVNLNARMYDPWLGRFLAVDPVIASIYRLQALNPYSYVENDPLTLSDPSGMCFLTCPFRAIYDAYKTITKSTAGHLGRPKFRF